MTCGSPAGSLPRRVWTYWHQGWGNAPSIVQRCVSTWRQRNPGWVVHKLDAASKIVREALPATVDEVRPALPARSDLLRLSLLAKHGGVWADSTLWCARPLDAWIHEAAGPSGFFGYDRPSRDRPVDSWLLAARPGSLVVVRWLAEALRLLAETRRRAARRAGGGGGTPARMRLLGERIAARRTHLRFRHGYGRKWGRPYEGLLIPTVEHPKLGVYFWVQYLFRKLLDSDEEFRQAWAATPKIAAAGPLKLLRAGLLEPADAGIAAAVRNGSANVFKATWKVGMPSDPAGTVLGELLASADDEAGTAKPR